MSRLTRLLAAVALFALASSAWADSVHLLAPADGATLRGGSLAELRWSATQLPAADEEWEAFLSVDGGRYYGFRVTPHLDIELRRFTFFVPNVDTNDARILIRTGDERHETGFEAPGSFSIVRDPNVTEVLPRRRTVLEADRGEAARDGDRAVFSWTEGTRNGSGVTQQSSTTVPSPPPAWQHTTVTSEEWPAEAPVDDDSLVVPFVRSPRSSARVRVARKIQSVPTSADLLLVCRRRNI